MDFNLVHSKIQQFATPKTISVSEFLDLLKTSSRSQKMSIRWFTEGSADGSGKPPHTSQHLMWWDSSLYVGGSAGGSATITVRAGVGGTGIVSTITGTSKFYAGGGGGASNGANDVGRGGAGGGGDGARIYAGYTAPALTIVPIPGTAGVRNTGGGAGGTAFQAPGVIQPSAAGGSGTVIIRHPSYFPVAKSVTNGTTYIAPPYRVYVFNTSGSITF